MVIVPLITGSIISGVAGVGANRGLGRLFSKTFGWYVTTSLLAILTGLLLVNLVRPGLAGGDAVGAPWAWSRPRPSLQADLEGRGAGELVGILQRMIPDNPVAAAAEGQMLPLIFFCVLLGLAVTGLPAGQRDAADRVLRGPLPGHDAHHRLGHRDGAPGRLRPDGEDHRHRGVRRPCRRCCATAARCWRPC